MHLTFQSNHVVIDTEHPDKSFCILDVKCDINKDLYELTNLKYDEYRGIYDYF